MNDARPGSIRSWSPPGSCCRRRAWSRPTAPRPRSPRCARRPTASAPFSAKVRCRCSASATCRCPGRTARCRAGSICPTVSTARRCWSTRMAAASCRAASRRWDHFLRDLVRQSGVAALSVDYQLSPEVNFPVAFDEVVAMTRLMAREGAGFGIDPTRLALGGDSAGANLALAAALALRDAGESGAQVPAADLRLLFDRLRQPVLAALRPGRRAVADPDALDLGDLSGTAGAIAATGGPRRLSADLKGVAPAHLIVGSLDPLLDDNNDLAAKLKAAGVPAPPDGLPGHQPRLHPLRQADRHRAARDRRVRRGAEGRDGGGLTTGGGRPGC